MSIFRHRITDVEDVLFSIFSHVASAPPPISGYITSASDVNRINQPKPLLTLFRLATTCRAFLEPALHFLWKEIPGDGPLISLLCCLGIAKRKPTAKEAPSRIYAWSRDIDRFYVSIRCPLVYKYEGV